MSPTAGVPRYKRVMFDGEFGIAIDSGNGLYMFWGLRG